MMENKIRKIRDYIDKPHKRYTLRKNHGLWLQLCSCLDTIGDTEDAVNAYFDGEYGASVRAQYLAIYGLLQAFIVQQDAAKHLCESLGMLDILDNCSEPTWIRDIRNLSIGHPTKKDRPKKAPIAYSFISQVSLTPTGFDLLSGYSDGTHQITTVSVQDALADQRRYISKVLDSVIDKLQEEVDAHKTRFRMQKLEAVFPPTFGYYFEKIFEGIERPELKPMGRFGLVKVREAIEAFRDALAKRGIELDTYDSVRQPYELIEYPMAQLDIFFQEAASDSTSIINDETAYIFAWFISNQVDALMKVAQRLDADYAA